MTIAAVLAATAAQAQDSPARVDAAALDEIVVTARKTAESLQEAPVAVAAFSAEALAARQMSSISDLARFTPGLVFDKSFGRSNERPVIRGMSNILANQAFGVESGAAYFVDGIYYPGDIQSLDFGDLERVEVIRGPQSALYGRNTYAGAINFVTRSPSETFKGEVRANADADERNVWLRLEGPLSSTLRGAVSLTDQQFDGQWKNEVTQRTVGEEQTRAASGVLEWTPTDALRVRLRGSYTEDRDGPRAFWAQGAVANNCYPGTRSLASFALSQSTNDNQYFCGTLGVQPIYSNDGPWAGPVVLAPGVPATATTAPPSTLYNTGPGVALSGVERNRRLWSALVNWDLAGGYSIQVAGALRGEDRRKGEDTDFMSFNLISDASRALGNEAAGIGSLAEEWRDHSVQAIFSSPTQNRVRWLVGAFYYDQSHDSFEINFKYPKGQSAPYAEDEIRNQAAFALAEWRFAEGWSVTGEGRYYEETKKAIERPSLLDSPGAIVFNSRDTWTGFTPRATLKWQAAEHLNLYAIYAKGDKPGGFNGAAGDRVGRPSYLPEESDNYELGAKTAWLDGRVVLNVAAYLIKAKDLQLNTPLEQPGSGALVSIATNQGSGEVKGVEIDGRWRVTDGFTLGVTYARADSEFTRGCDDFQWTLTSGGGLLNLTNPSASTNPNGRGNCSIVGHQFPLSARHTASVTADWRRPFGATFEWFVNADANYVSRRAVQVHNLAWVPAATVANARIGLSADAWTVAAYAKNLTNEDAPPNATRWLQYPYATFLGSPLRAGLPATGRSYNLPRNFFGSFRRERQIGLDATYRF
jgi:outer membrane receptor protein involved in Fe transport